MVQRVVLILTLMIGCYCSYGQGFLGKTKADIFLAAKDCEQEGNYQGSIAFKCGGRKSFFYFTAKDSTCDLYATDLDTAGIRQTKQKLEASGFMKEKTKYMEPFLVSKHTNHQKFPAQIYSNGKVQYCFMPVSLNGKSTELNAVITMLIKKEK